MSEARVLRDAEEMLEVASLQLADIHFDRLSIEAHTPSAQPDLDGEASEMKLEVDLSLATRQEGNQFGARFEFQVMADSWTARIGVITEYVGVEEFELAPSAPGDFASRVALMAAFPYVREALSDLTTRVTGSAVLLPLIRHGELQFMTHNN